MSKWEFSNPPSNITSTPTSISFTTHPNTDFWHPPTRLAANGHFYYTKAVLPYSYGIHLQCSFQGEWKVTYDQGGVMIREAGSQTKWIKAGVEFVDGKAYLSSVVSNPHSDWAVAPYPLPAGQPLTIRLTYDRGPHGLIHLQYHNGTKWVVFREITGWIIEIGKEYEIGVMACSPGQSSFKVDFWDLVANDYSEIAFSLGEAQFWGALNPNLNPETFGPT